jgi:hypothetical protein
MKNDLICFSHLRWNFVYQRPQHLMSRFARTQRVFYFEEPIFGNSPDKLSVRLDQSDHVFVVTPELEECKFDDSIHQRLGKLLDELINTHEIFDFVAWYYFPLAINYSNHLKPHVIVYDCMDELSAFKDAPSELIDCERRLLANADIVFTGGYRLYEAKKHQHKNIFPFPSAIDKDFFYPARTILKENPDQKSIPHPRLGFYGVIDERFDIDLVRKMASLRPGWHFIFIGPVVKIEASTLPLNDNIHYLGIKDYKELPSYISGWDLCIMPFAINASTEFISPTKTPEFLAAGKRVISTPIHDVVKPYGINGLVTIAETAEQFIETAEHDLRIADKIAWLYKVDQFLNSISWEETWNGMSSRIDIALRGKKLFYNIKTKKSHVRFFNSGSRAIGGGAGRKAG